MNEIDFKTLNLVTGLNMQTIEDFKIEFENMSEEEIVRDYGMLGKYHIFEALIKIGNKE